MTSLNPIGKVVYLCDDVLRDPASGKIHFIGIFDDVVPAADASYPFRLGTMCVVAQLVGGIGQVAMHVEVVEGATQRLVRRVGPLSITFPARQQVITACIRVQGCLFPAPGIYFVELHAGGRFLDDRRLRLH
jgi:hypothetical protein